MIRTVLACVTFFVALVSGPVYAQKSAQVASVLEASFSKNTEEVCGGTPFIRDLRFSAPAPGALLQHQQLVYVQGNLLQVSFTAPDCQQVRSVSIGGRSLYPAGTCIDCDAGTYTVLGKTQVGAGQWRFTVQMSFPNYGDGASAPVVVAVGERELVVAGARQRVVATVSNTATASFTKVNVREVGAPQLLTVSQTHLQDSFTRSIWDMYGDDGSYTDPGTDLSSTADDGRTLYNPKYPVGLEIKTDGIHFGWSTKASVDNWCNPTVDFSGVFVLDHDITGVTARWTRGLDVSLDYAWYCDIAGAIVGLFYDMGESMIKNTIEAQMEEDINTKINEAFAGNCGGFPCALFIQNITHQQGYVDISFRFPVDSVSIDVPYGVHKMNNTYARFALNPQDKVIVLGGGTARVENTDGWYAPGGYIQVSPTGTYSNQNMFLHAPLSSQATKVWNAMHVVSRTAGTLPRASSHAGMLMARVWRGETLAETTLSEVGNTAQFTMPACGSTKLSFGVNDSTKDPEQFYPRGSGTFKVSVLWPPGGVANAPQRMPLPCIMEEAQVESVLR